MHWILLSKQSRHRLAKAILSHRLPHQPQSMSNLLPEAAAAKFMRLRTNSHAVLQIQTQAEYFMIRVTRSRCGTIALLVRVLAERLKSLTLTQCTVRAEAVHPNLSHLMAGTEIGDQVRIHANLCAQDTPVTISSKCNRHSCRPVSKSCSNNNNCNNKIITRISSSSSSRTRSLLIAGVMTAEVRCQTCTGGTDPATSQNGDRRHHKSHSGMILVMSLLRLLLLMR